MIGHSIGERDMKEDSSRLGGSTLEVVQARVRTYLVKGAFAKLVMVAILFLTSGRWDWWMGWVLFGIYVTWDTVVALLFIPNHPELIAERAAIYEGTAPWDIVLASLAASLTPMATWIMAGLDLRFGWTGQISPILQFIAFIVIVLGFALVTWAMYANQFFSTIFRIQHDRNHSVVTSGPYRFVRHPGYVGAIMFQLGTPILLSSLWGFLPSGLSVLFYIIRTWMEDRTLVVELAGYRAYTERVRYRLLPGVW
jgi:protein-S-isoprenylcysteine O-methyltransferase Ste14